MKKRLIESEYTDIIENVCDDINIWDRYGKLESRNIKKSNSNSFRYGLKEANGVKYLSGPGTEGDQHAGMMHGGGKWPYRFTSLKKNLYLIY